MKFMYKHFNAFVYYFYNHQENVVFGFLMWLLTYFAEIKGSVMVMSIAFAFDLFFGIWSNVWKNKQKFQMSKVFVQFERYLITLIIVMLLFAMDRENEQSVAAVYSGVTWLVTGFLIYSIAENGFNITGWNLFKIIKAFVQKKAQSITEVDIKEIEDGTK